MVTWPSSRLWKPGSTELESRETGKRAVGFIAPFVYVDVSLIDVATGNVIKRKTIMAGRAAGAYANAAGVNAWEALTAAEKVSMLTSLLTEQLQSVVPPLLASAPH